jgi:hypothetical protein
MSSLSPSKKYLKLFAGCVPVQGARRTVVVDTQRGAHFFIPNDLHTLLGPQQCLDLPVLRATYRPVRNVFAAARAGILYR